MISAAQIIVGASLSSTVTLIEHVAVLPAASVTVNTFVVVPAGKDDPLASPELCTVVAPLQLSVPVGAV